jgi:hypothetical protein
MYKKEKRSSKKIRGCGELPCVSHEFSKNDEDLRWGQTIKGEKKQHKPEDCVNRLDGKLCRGEQEWEEGDMARDRQRPESAKESAVMQRDQTERNDNKQDCLFMNMPAKEEGRVSTERDRTNKRFPRWFVEQSKQYRLYSIST